MGVLIIPGMATYCTGVGLFREIVMQGVSVNLLFEVMKCLMARVRFPQWPILALPQNLYLSIVWLGYSYPV